MTAVVVSGVRRAVMSGFRRIVVSGFSRTIIMLALAGCTRGADQARLQQDLQARLDHDVQPQLFQVVGLRREGSAPLPSNGSAKRVIVYFNTTLKVAKDYSFGGWEQLGPSTVAYVLGATEKGVFGLQPQNHAGDLVRAYGSAVYEEGPNGWMPVAATATARSGGPPSLDGTGPSTRSKALIDQLAAMVNVPPPGVGSQKDEIIADELARASEAIERRVQRRQRVFTLATGPESGEYARFGDSLIDAIKQAAPDVKLRQRYSAGSAENIRLLARGEADYAVAQGDVAGAAFDGTGPFAQGGAVTTLRAVGGLRADAVHILVRPESSLRDVSQLRGKRVELGAEGSGTRFDAVAVLDALGLSAKDLGEARGDGLDTGLDRLSRGQLDAVFVTAPAPMRALQPVAAAGRLRLLPLPTAAINKALRSTRGLEALTLPARTYPLQQDPVATVASTTLLLTTTAAPNGEVRRLKDFIYSRLAQSGGGAVQTAGTEQRGITVPLHPGAAPDTAGP